MKYELAGIKDGIELYNPVAENAFEERELELRMERCVDVLAKIILNHYQEIKELINESGIEQE